MSGVTVYSLDVLLYQFWTILLFHIWFSLLLDLHTGFTGGRQGNLVFPSLEKFSTICCDPQSQCGRPGFNPWVGKISWRRKWQPTPVFLPGKSHGRRSLLGYSSWGRKELDTTEQLHFHFHTVKVFSIVSEAVDIFLEFSCFFYDPMDAGSLISGSSAFSKSNLYIWKFLVHILLKPSLKDFEHYLASMWNECSCAVVWTLFGLVFWGDRNENWRFPVLWPLSFPDLLAYWVQHFNSIIL